MDIINFDEEINDNDKKILSNQIEKEIIKNLIKINNLKLEMLKKNLEKCKDTNCVDENLTIISKIENSNKLLDQYNLDIMDKLNLQEENIEENQEDFDNEIDNLDDLLNNFKDNDNKLVLDKTDYKMDNLFDEFEKLLKSLNIKYIKLFNNELKNNVIIIDEIDVDLNILDFPIFFITVSHSLNNAIDNKILYKQDIYSKFYELMLNEYKQNINLDYLETASKIKKLYEEEYIFLPHILENNKSFNEFLNEILFYHHNISTELINKIKYIEQNINFSSIIDFFRQAHTYQHLTQHILDNKNSVIITKQFEYNILIKQLQKNNFLII